MLNCKCETSFKFILKGKKLSNISKAALIVRPSTRAVNRVRGSFIINDFKIIHYKVHCLASLTTL
jgi:hypothetical protein